jgi:hypothetical protein
VSTTPRRTIAAPLVGALLASVAVSACGGSSKHAVASTAGSASTATARTLATATRATGNQSGRAQGGAGTAASHGGTRAPAAGGGSNPSGNASSGSHGSGHGAPTYSPALRSAIVTFTGCMREHGIKLHAPNFNGKPSEILSSKGIDTKSAQFQSAMNACGTDLLAILRAGGASLPGASG